MGKLILGVLIGFAVMFLGVMGATWAAAGATGVGMEEDPTTTYLVLNLLGSFLAAGLGGFIATGFADGRMAAAWALAATLVLLSLSAILGDPATGRPGWYPLAVAALGVAGVLGGGAIAVRHTRSARESGVLRGQERG